MSRKGDKASEDATRCVSLLASLDASAALLARIDTVSFGGGTAKPKGRSKEKEAAHDKAVAAFVKVDGEPLLRVVNATTSEGAMILSTAVEQLATITSGHLRRACGFASGTELLGGDELLVVVAAGQEVCGGLAALADRAGSLAPDLDVKVTGYFKELESRVEDGLRAVARAVAAAEAERSDEDGKPGDDSTIFIHCSLFSAHGLRQKKRDHHIIKVGTSLLVLATVI